MTAFSTDYLATAWPVLSATFGETVSHTPSGGSPENATAIWQVTGEDVEHYEDGSQTVKEGTLSVDPADLTTFGLQSTFSIDSQTYAVKSVSERTPILVLQLVDGTHKRAGGANTRRSRY